MDTWTTQDGRQIPVRELRDSHLINIAKMLVRHAKITELYESLALFTGNNIPDQVVDELIHGDIEHGIPVHWHVLVNDVRYTSINAELKRRSIGKGAFEEYDDWVFEPVSEWYPGWGE